MKTLTQSLRQTAYKVIAPRFELNPKDYEKLSEFHTDDEETVDGTINNLVSMQIDMSIQIIAIWLLEVGTELLSDLESGFNGHS